MGTRNAGQKTFDLGVSMQPVGAVLVAFGERLWFVLVFAGFFAVCGDFVFLWGFLNAFNRYRRRQTLLPHERHRADRVARIAYAETEGVTAVVGAPQTVGHGEHGSSFCPSNFHFSVTSLFTHLLFPLCFIIPFLSRSLFFLLSFFLDCLCREDSSSSEESSPGESVLVKSSGSTDS